MKIKNTHILLLLVLLFCGASHSFAKDKNKKEKKSKEKATAPDSKEDVETERIFIEAERAKLIEDYPEAIEKYTAVLKKSSKNDNVYFQLAKIYAAQGNLPTAQENIDKAIKLVPNNQWYLELQASLFARRNMRKEAIAAYEKLLKNFPYSPDKYFELAFLYLQGGDAEMAIKTYDQFEKVFGLEESIIFQKERIYIKSGKVDKAAAELQKLINAYPDEVSYWEMLAELYDINNYKDKATEVYKKILAIEPNNSKAIMALANIGASKGDTAAQIESMKKIFANPNFDVDSKIKMLFPFLQFSQANKEKLPLALELADLLTTTHPNESKAWAIKGDLYYINEQEDLALPAYLKSLEKQKDVFMVWQQVMAIYADKKDWANTLKIANDALELFPNQAIIYFYKGNAESQTKAYESAIKSFSKGEKMSLENVKLRAQFFANLGDTYHEMQKNAESDTAYEKSLRIDPDNVYVLNNYSYYLSTRKENLEKAKAMSELSNKLAPRNSSFLDTYAWILFQLKEYEKAKDWQEKALLYDKNSSTLLEHYGDILYHLNNVEKAVEYWQKAKELGAKSTTLDQKISQRKYIE